MLLENNEEAKKGFKEILLDKSVPPELRGGSSFHLGKIYQAEKNDLRAHDFFRQCLEFIPDHKKAAARLRNF
jgi:hypothetical protein